jgi:hypothetical protein
MTGVQRESTAAVSVRLLALGRVAKSARLFNEVVCALSTRCFPSTSTWFLK